MDHPYGDFTTAQYLEMLSNMPLTQRLKLLYSSSTYQQRYGRIGRSDIPEPICPTSPFEGEGIAHLSSLERVNNAFPRPGTIKNLHRFTLSKPYFPPVRDFVWKLKLIKQEELEKVSLFFYPHELQIITFSADNISTTHGLLRPICGCCKDEYLKELAIIIYYGWKSGTVQGILSQLVDKNPYSLLIIAACSWMLPQSIYDELTTMLPVLNKLMNDFHCFMLDPSRKTSPHALLLSMLEDTYRYTFHCVNYEICIINDPSLPVPQFEL